MKFSFLLNIINFAVPILRFLDLNDGIAPVNTLGRGVDVVSQEIFIDIGFPTISSASLHTIAYVS